jgi:hypothetical protein
VGSGESSIAVTACATAPRTAAWPSTKLLKRASRIARTTRSGNGSPKLCAVHSLVGRRDCASGVSATAAPSPGAVVVP